MVLVIMKHVLGQYWAQRNTWAPTAYRELIALHGRQKGGGPGSFSVVTPSCQAVFYSKIEHAFDLRMLPRAVIDIECEFVLLSSTFLPQSHRAQNLRMYFDSRDSK
jgi:hypothetical protein